jgi:hypothetical protein
LTLLTLILLALLTLLPLLALLVLTVLLVHKSSDREETVSGPFKAATGFLQSACRFLGAM